MMASFAVDARHRAPMGLSHRRGFAAIMANPLEVT